MIRCPKRREVASMITVLTVVYCTGGELLLRYGIGDDARMM